jgi:DNA repair photolyase
MKKRFGQVKSYTEWTRHPKLVSNAIELLQIELLTVKPECVQLCFATDPFPYNQKPEGVRETTHCAIKVLNRAKVPCSILTKGILPDAAWLLYRDDYDTEINHYGITLVSLDENYRKHWEPGAAPIKDRLLALKNLSDHGCNTWVSIEPYPTPNIIEQDLNQLLESVAFVDKIVFGRANYSLDASKYPGHKSFYNSQAKIVRKFCLDNSITCHIKAGTES